MKQYLDLLKTLLESGTERSDRTGVGTKSIFGYQMRFNLGDGFPMLTTKKLHTKSIIYELLWFLQGSTNIKYLQDHEVKIWDEWATEAGDLGPVYGKQWRSWEGPDGKTYDQITELIENLKNKPNSRRHIICAWNVPYLPDESVAPNENAAQGKMALPPCHCLFQFYVTPPASHTLSDPELAEGESKGTLSCQLYQRSADVFLGVPFNIASYSLLTHMVAQVCSLEPGDFVHTFGDVHLYLNHLEQAKEQLSREPRALPQLKINPDKKDIFGFEFEDFEIINYDPHPHIRAPIAI